LIINADGRNSGALSAGTVLHEENGVADAGGSSVHLGISVADGLGVVGVGYGPVPKVARATEAIRTWGGKRIAASALELNRVKDLIIVITNTPKLVRARLCIPGALGADTVPVGLISFAHARTASVYLFGGARRSWYIVAIDIGEPEIAEVAHLVGAWEELGGQ
jgi:hypothetical protein